MSKFRILPFPWDSFIVGLGGGLLMGILLLMRGFPPSIFVIVVSTILSSIFIGLLWMVAEGWKSVFFIGAGAYIGSTLLVYFVGIL